jgi:tetratricopeptide (TPR) repeat protein
MVEITAPGYAPRKMGIHLPSEFSWLDLFEVRLEKMRIEPSAAPPEPASVVDTSLPTITVSDPDTPASWEDVRAALAEGRVHHAQRVVPSVDPGTPGGAHIFFEIGRDLLTAGKTEEAVGFFDHALERDPDHADAHYRRALALLALGRLEEARRDLEAVVELRPESGVAAKAGLVIEQLSPTAAGPARSFPSPLGPGTAE